MRSSSFGSLVASAAVLALSGCGMSERVVGEGRRRARERDADAKAKPPAPDPVANLPGETNRQLAARMAALRNAAEAEAAA